MGRPEARTIGYCDAAAFREVKDERLKSAAIIGSTIDYAGLMRKQLKRPSFVRMKRSHRPIPFAALSSSNISTSRI